MQSAIKDASDDRVSMSMLMSFRDTASSKLFVRVCVCMGVFLLCMNVLDVQERRHFPDEKVDCFQRAVVSTQPARFVDTHGISHRSFQILRYCSN